MKKVRLGIIGVGNIGSAHAESIFTGNIKGLQLVAICDINPDRLSWAKNKFPSVYTYSDYQNLLNNDIIDAVIIAVPHYLHPDIAIKAFMKGKHVLTEKPAGVYTKQVRQMNKAASLSDKVFCIMFNQRTNPIFQKAREIVKGGRLGEPKRLVWIITNWYRNQAYYDSGTWRATWDGEGGGVLLNQAPHNLDLWQWIFGMPTRVRAFCGYGKYHNIEVEDDVTIYAEYENGATASFITSTGEYPGTNRLEISGDRGKLVIEDGKLRLWELAEPEREFCFNPQKSYDDKKTKYYEYTPVIKNDAHNEILQNFTNSILYGEKLISSGSDGINELSISNAAYLSDWTNDWVELPVNDEIFYKQLSLHFNKDKSNNNQKHIELPNAKYKKRWNVNW